LRKLKVNATPTPYSDAMDMSLRSVTHTREPGGSPWLGRVSPPPDTAGLPPLDGAAVLVP